MHTTERETAMNAADNPLLATITVGTDRAVTGFSLVRRVHITSSVQLLPDNLEPQTSNPFP